MIFFFKTYSNLKIIKLLLILLSSQLCFCLPPPKTKIRGMLSLFSGSVSRPINVFFSVGGTVSGLTGSGLVIQNNYRDSLTISSNGSFTFSSTLQNEGFYSVTVATQPSLQTCTVSAGSGQIMLSDISSVQIVCLNNGNTFTIGGSLSQMLGGNSITLQNNGGDNLTLSSNGNFTFPTALANNTNYSVTILTNAPTQTCVLSNSSGTISSANIININITCSGNANGPLVNGTIINTLTLTGGVTTFTGSPCPNSSTCGAGINGFVDSATPSSVRFNSPEGMVTDGFYLYIADRGNQRIRRVTLSTGEVTTFAGSGTAGFVDGFGTAAQLSDPRFIGTDGTYLYVGDNVNFAVRKIHMTTSQVTTILTSFTTLNDPRGFAVYNNNLYVTDFNNNAIRQIDLSTNTLTTVVSTGLNSPSGLALVGTNLYIGDKNSDSILKTTIGVWAISTFAGSSSGYTNATGISALFRNPEGVTTDGVNLYVADIGNNAIRKIVVSTAAVTTLAGPLSNLSGYVNDFIFSNARFNTPSAVTSDGIRLYVTDNNNHTIRMIQ